MMESYIWGALTLAFFSWALYTLYKELFGTVWDVKKTKIYLRIRGRYVADARYDEYDKVWRVSEWGSSHPDKEFSDVQAAIAYMSALSPPPKPPDLRKEIKQAIREVRKEARRQK